MTQKINFTMIFKLLFKNIWIILLFAVLGAEFTYFTTEYNKIPIYTAKATMYVANANYSSTDGKWYFSTGEFYAAKELVNLYTQLVKSSKVCEEVAEKLDNKYSADYIRGSLSISSLSETSIMVIYSTTTNMQTSVDICNAVLDAAPEVFTSVVKFGYCEPVDNAYMPKYPVQSNPRSLRNTFVSGFMGVAVAIALILLIYMLDNRIKGTSDIKDNYQVAILGEIPNFSLKSDERYSNYGSSKEKGQRRGY